MVPYAGGVAGAGDEYHMDLEAKGEDPPAREDAEPRPTCTFCKAVLCVIFFPCTLPVFIIVAGMACAMLPFYFCCWKWCLQAVDLIFLGPYLRALFTEEQGAKDVRSSLISMLTAIGVVGALFMTSAMAFAMGKAKDNSFGAAGQFFWLATTYCSLACTVMAGLVGVLISITPATRVRVLGRRTMYIIAFPAHLLAISCVGTMTAIWMTAEAEFSQNPGMTGALFVVGWVRFVSIVFYLAFMIAVAGAVLFSDFILKLAHAPRDQNARVEAREE